MPSSSPTPAPDGLATDERPGQPPTLYRFWDAEGTYLYAGRTLNPGQRWKQHSNEAWWEEVATITVERFASEDEVRVAEVLSIDGEVPLHNRRRGSLPGVARKTVTEAKARARAEGLDVTEVLRGMLTDYATYEL